MCIRDSHCHDLETLKTGIRAKEKLGCKVIFDSHEFEQNKNPPADELTNSFIRSHEGKLIKKVDSVVTVSNEIAENLKEIYNLPPYVLLREVSFFFFLHIQTFLQTNLLALKSYL